VKSRGYRVGIVQSGDAEIDGLRLMIDLHQKWRSASPAELAMAEA
jgi:hypothetical protein